MNNIDKLKKIINDSKKIVFFSGAGISTLSGLKDFRSQDGLYNMKFNYPPEEILSHHFFINNQEVFYDFYRKYMNPLAYKPNIIHYYLKNLEKDKDVTIITQNIDNFHTLAGSSKVLELHGNVMRNYCMDCHKYYDGVDIFKDNDVPRCSCGGIIKPDVVLYEEALDDNIVNESIKALCSADTLIVAGTSLNVYPAAGLIKYFKGNNLILINKDKTPMDYLATLIINEDLKDVFKQLV